MCYVGKATKIFIFIVSVLVMVGLVLGFTFLRHGFEKPHKCTNGCRPIFPQPVPVIASAPPYSPPTPVLLTSPPPYSPPNPVLVTSPPPYIPPNPVLVTPGPVHA